MPRTPKLSRRALLRGAAATAGVAALGVGAWQVRGALARARWQRTAPSRLVLRGRIVTMDRDAPVIEDGRIFISASGTIDAVRPASDAIPDAYRAARTVETAGAIYPGLVDLHNHPYFDLHPLWTPPRRTPYQSRYEWGEEVAFREQVADDSSPTGVDWRFAREEALKYVQLKALVGGVTTLQGLGLNPPPSEGAFMRHVEAESIDGHRAAASYVVRPAVHDPFAVFRETMAKGSAVIHHLSEGSDPALGQEFEELLANDCIGPRFVGIHANALSADQLHRWGQRGGSLVWSPLSNLWLYGQTTNVAAAREAGLRLCLGPDWSPGGSKNLLGELKVADLWNRTRLGSLFGDRELCEMVSSNSADAIGLGSRIGRIRPGCQADLVVIASRGDPYRDLIRATEATVRLVLVDGHPRYGTPELLAAAGAVNVSALRVSDTARGAGLPDPTIDSSTLAWDDIVASLERVRALQHGTRDLPFVPHFEMQPLDTLAPDDAWFARLEAAPIPNGQLAGLRAYYT